MLRLGIIGFPLEHTLSPVMHEAALQHLNINGEYKAYEIKEGELEKTFKDLKKQCLRGFSVTIPHKKSIIPLLDELTERAKLIGAVNTVTIEAGGKTIGDNTDVIGFWDAIPEEIRKNIPKETTSIIGCGGAANACIAALIMHEAKNIKIYGRNKDKLNAFKNHLVKMSHRGISTAHIEIDLLGNIDLSNTFMLVNTTPLGMYPNINDSPVSKEELKKLPQDALVYDIIYNPSETKLLKDAKALNKKTLNGLEMLIRQGAASFTIWTGKEAPIEVMRNAVVW